MDGRDRVREALARGKRAALVTVVDAVGAPPSRPGQVLAVVEDGGVEGTLGCDGFDRAGIADAMAAMRDGAERRRTYDWDDTSRIAVRVRPFRPGDPVAADETSAAEVLVVGAGAVARALVAFARLAGFRVRVVTGPFERGPRDADGADEVLEWRDAERLVTLDVGPETYVVICGHDEEFSQPALRALLPSRAPYLGMMGSRRHTGHLLAELRAAGFTEAQLARVHSPVGLPIGAETPEEIALSALAQVVAERRHASGSSRGST